MSTTSSGLVVIIREAGSDALSRARHVAGHSLDFSWHVIPTLPDSSQAQQPLVLVTILLVCIRFGMGLVTLEKQSSYILNKTEGMVLQKKKKKKNKST